MSTMEQREMTLERGDEELEVTVVYKIVYDTGEPTVSWLQVFHKSVQLAMTFEEEEILIEKIHELIDADDDCGFNYEEE